MFVEARQEGRNEKGGKEEIERKIPKEVHPIRSGRKQKKINLMNLIEIHFAGGMNPAASKNEQGRKFGCHEILLNGKSIRKMSKIDLGRGTENEATFEALIHALDWICLTMDRSGLEADLEAYSVKMFTCSTIVRNRIMNARTGGSDDCSISMGRLTKICLDLLIGFKDYSIEWNSSEHFDMRFEPLSMARKWRLKNIESAKARRFKRRKNAR